MRFSSVPCSFATNSMNLARIYLFEGNLNDWIWRICCQFILSNIDQPTWSG
jgi:hypothetical protein